MHMHVSDINIIFSSAPAAKDSGPSEAEIAMKVILQHSHAVDFVPHLLLHSKIILTISINY